MRWDPNAELKLLLKVLESNPGITCNAEKVAEQWSEGEERPTPRAVRDRFNMIKKRLKSGSSVTKSPAKINKRESAAKTPVKASKNSFKDSPMAYRRPLSGTKSNKNLPRSQKKGQALYDEFDDNHDTEEEDDDAEEGEGTKDEGVILIKDEIDFESIDDIDETPSKIRNDTSRRSMRPKAKSITTYLMDGDQGEDDDVTLQNGRAGDADDEDDGDFDILAFRAEQNGGTTSGAKVARWRQALADLTNEEEEY